MFPVFLLLEYNTKGFFVREKPCGKKYTCYKCIIYEPDACGQAVGQWNVCHYGARELAEFSRVVTLPDPSEFEPFRISGPTRPDPNRDILNTSPANSPGEMVINPVRLQY